MNSTSTTTTQTVAFCTFCPKLSTNGIFAVIFFSVVAIGVCGNIFVATVILTDRKLLHASVNLFLLNLAIADLGNLLCCSPDIALVLYASGWLLPHFLCPVLRFLQEYFLYASVLMQMSIGIERFLAICSPMRMQRFSRRASCIMIAFVWIVAALFASPYMMYQRIFTYGNLKICFWRRISAKRKLMFKYAECVVLYVLPLVLLTILYSIMGRMLWGNSKTIANERQQLAVLRLRRSVVRMLIISILIYFVCYSPLQGIFITEVIMKKHLRIGHVMRLILNALSFSSSAANPIIYIVCCRHFRSRFFDAIRICVSIPCFWRPSPFRSADFSTRNNSASPYTSLKMKFGAHIEHIRSDKSQKSSTKKDFVRVSRWSPSVRLIGRTHSSNSLSRMDE